MAARTEQTAHTEQKEAEVIEKLAEEAQITLDADDEKKDRKESRKIAKNRFYSGPYKMKHIIPRGKRL